MPGMKYFLFLFLMILLVFPGFSQKNVIDNEANVPNYVLPELLVFRNGKDVKTQKQWKKRRSEIVGLFERIEYGKIPGKIRLSKFEILEESDNAINNKAVRKQVLLTFKKDKKQLSVNLLIYLPKSVEKAPLFVGYNFSGNHTILSDSEIFLTEAWVANSPSLGIINHQVTEQSRGATNNRWPVEKIIDAGYGLATMYYGEVDPDMDDFTDGIHPLLYTEGQTKPADDEWGSIAAWAWGLSRAYDYFKKDKSIDDSRIIVMGHSRLGKTSLWAGAADTRFAMVISNNSGCGGAALSRRSFGETVEKINKSFPHWFCTNFKRFNNYENALPMDQHMLIALMAPRPVYIASAEDDKWADPYGEFLSAFYASPGYKLFDYKGMANKQLPEINKPIMNRIGYHIRSGKHDVTDFDWEQFIRFADLHLTKSQD